MTLPPFYDSIDCYQEEIIVKNWINRHITHNRDKDGDFGIRMLLHIPIGIILSIPVFSWGLIYLFKFYERNEDAHCEDEAWKDTYGAIVGYIIGLFLQIGVILWVSARLGWF